MAGGRLDIYFDMAIRKNDSFNRSLNWFLIDNLSFNLRAHFMFVLNPPQNPVPDRLISCSVALLVTQEAKKTTKIYLTPSTNQPDIDYDALQAILASYKLLLHISFVLLAKL